MFFAAVYSLIYHYFSLFPLANQSGTHAGVAEYQEMPQNAPLVIPPFLMEVCSRIFLLY